MRSEIDRIYKRLSRIKYEINRILGKDSNEEVNLEMISEDLRVKKFLRKFSYLLKHVSYLKQLRRMTYRKIDGVKKSWFGWCSNQVASLAQKYHALVVVEDSTFLAVEKISSEYKGRMFNKLLNNGSKGQLIRRLSMRLRWQGIPQEKIPSYYTSSTDARFSVVDKAQRQGSVFRSQRDGRIMQADLHASLTIALYPLLRRILVDTNSLQSVTKSNPIKH